MAHEAVKLCDLCNDLCFVYLVVSMLELSWLYVDHILVAGRRNTHPV